MVKPTGPICVIGAGIIGAAAALHLIEAGASDVIVVDASEPLGGTTPAGAGFVACFGADHNRRLGGCTVPLQAYGVEFYTRLHESGFDIEFASNGNVVLGLTPDMVDSLAGGIVNHPDVVDGTRRLDADEVVDVMRGAVDPAAVAGGVYMPEGIQLTTGLAQQALLAQLEQAGVHFQWNTQVTGLSIADDAVTAVETSNGPIDVAAVVLAAGAWNQGLLEAMRRPLPLIPMVATRFVSEPAGLSPLMPTVQCPELRLWLRELHGGFSWGGGFAYRLLSALRDEGLHFDYGRPVSSSLIDAQHAAQDQIAEVFPALGGCSTVEIIQGVPVYTVDGGLYIGAVPGIAGAWALAGDSESGITHGPGMGKLIAQLIMQDDPFVDPTPFRLDRIDTSRYPTEAALVQAMAEERIATTAKRG